MPPWLGASDGDFLVEVSLEFDKVLFSRCRAPWLILALKASGTDSFVSQGHSLSFEGFQFIIALDQPLLDNFNERRNRENLTLAIEEPTTFKRIIEDEESNTTRRYGGAESLAEGIRPVEDPRPEGLSHHNLSIVARGYLMRGCQSLKCPVRNGLGVAGEELKALPNTTPAVVLKGGEAWEADFAEVGRFIAKEESHLG